MTPIDYKILLTETFKRICGLISLREATEAELAKQKQLYFATLNLLPDEDRVSFQAQIDELAASGDDGLTEAIKNVLLASDGWMTTAMVRDKLRKTGFDFKNFGSNPLASIGTILRRWKPEEVECAQVEGVNAYRWKKSEYSGFEHNLTEILAGIQGLSQIGPDKTKEKK